MSSVLSPGRQTGRYLDIQLVNASEPRASPENPMVAAVPLISAMIVWVVVLYGDVLVPGDPSASEGVTEPDR